MFSIEDLLTQGLPSTREIEFVPAQRDDKPPLPVGITVEFLNKQPQTTSKQHAQTLSDKAGPKAGTSGSRAKPVELGWKSVRRTAARLANFGATCYLNATLQALVHTAPLAQELLANEAVVGNGREAMVLRLMQQHVRECLGGSAPYVKPGRLLQVLHKLNPRLSAMEEADAHECLSALLDAMHEGSLAGLKVKPPPQELANTFVHRIFGGLTKSEVQCPDCPYVSRRYEPFVYLSLSPANSIKRALQMYTRSEELSGDNKWRCSAEKTLKDVRLCTSIHQPPNILALHLKRFRTDLMGSGRMSVRKLQHQVEYEPTLDLAPYTSHPKGGSQMYNLYALIVHHGRSVSSGHYIAYVKAPNGYWWLCDDTNLKQVSERVVFQQQAFLLFYARKTPAPLLDCPAAAATPTAPATAANAVSPSQKRPAAANKPSPRKLFAASKVVQKESEPHQSILQGKLEQLPADGTDPLCKRAKLSELATLGPARQLAALAPLQPLLSSPQWQAHLGKLGPIWSPSSRFRNLALHLSAAHHKRKQAPTAMPADEPPARKRRSPLGGQEPVPAATANSVVAFPSRHLQGANEQQDSARDEHSLDSLPARSKPSGQRMVKDPYWSGLSDADIARHKSLGGPKQRRKKRGSDDEEYDMGQTPKLKRDRESRPRPISGKEWLGTRT
ncbi:hypothetical protein WJX84_011697 [Apatococcus fuscideae]|uniref:ubiquitinyl hydrolase 1 n=1 Tax=Apatococcus fuscideae TaxID=2026836 RepID=A0AAW1TDN0_9CHLO